jgi:glycosyltransferase EpsD
MILQKKGRAVKKKILFCAPRSRLSETFIFRIWRPSKRRLGSLGRCRKNGSLPFVSHVVALPFQKKLASLQKPRRSPFDPRNFCGGKILRFVSTHTTTLPARGGAAWSIVAFQAASERPYVFCTSHGYLFSGKKLRDRVYLLVEKLCAPVRTR